MASKIYTAEQAEKVRQEFLPCREKYIAARKERIRLTPEDEKRLLDLSSRLTNYYVHKKVWASYNDFGEAMREASPFGMFNHRMSVAIRIVKIKDKRDPSANRLFFKNSRDMLVKSSLDEIR